MEHNLITPDMLAGIPIKWINLIIAIVNLTTIAGMIIGRMYVAIVNKGGFKTIFKAIWMGVTPERKEPNVEI